MSSQDVLHGLLARPARSVANATWKALLVRLLDPLLVLFRHVIAVDGLLAEESILQVASGVRLGLEKCVEIPEGRLDPAISWHLIEAH